MSDLPWAIAASKYAVAWCRRESFIRFGLRSTAQLPDHVMHVNENHPGLTDEEQAELVRVIDEWMEAGEHETADPMDFDPFKLGLRIPDHLGW